MDSSQADLSVFLKPLNKNYLKNFTMKKASTFKKISLFIMLGAFIVVQSTNAQQVVFSVSSPSNISGEYTMAAAEFGGSFPGLCNNVPAISGELAIGDDGDDEGGTGSTTDGCQALGDLTGKIALIDQSTCEFGEQCLNAQMAGAIAVIVCSNVSDDPIAMDEGSVGDQVTIPSLMLGMTACNTIRAEIPGAEVYINYKYNPYPGTANILWGNFTGQGDFKGGLNGWTTVNDGACPGFDLWRWSDDATATDGAFSTGGGISQSASACNGAMAFDSDFYDNNGDGGNLGNGDCPAPQNGELISPIIDLASVAGNDVEGVTLRFHQATRQFDSDYYVAYSNDGGTVWDDTIQINTDIILNSPHLNETRTVKLSCADPNSSNFRIKFIYTANYYYWIVDNVQLIESPPGSGNDLRLGDDWFAIAPNAVTPRSQVEPFSFMTDVYNIGANTQTGINLNVTIEDGSGGEVFSDDLPYLPIVCGDDIQNVPFNDYFTPDNAATDNYTGIYFVSSDSADIDLSNNTIEFTFSTSDTTFAKETGMTRTVLPAASNYGPEEAHSWAYGNYFYVVDGEDWNASSATFGLGNPNDPGIPNRLINIQLYKWEEDANLDGQMDPIERTKIGFHTYEILGNEGSSLITVPLTANPGSSLALESNSAYVLMVEYQTNDQVDFALLASEAYDYGAMIYRELENGTTPTPNTRYAAMLGVAGTLEDEPYSSLGFGWDIVPVVRLNIAPPVSNVKETLDDANIITISPNPADKKMNVRVDLVETHDKVNIRILDVNGRMIQEQIHNNMLSQTLEFTVSDFPSGVYFLNFITEKGVRTERFIVQH